MSRVAALFVALILAASPVLAAMCDASCAPVSAAPANAGHPTAHDPHAHHHAAAPADASTTRLADPSACPGHVPLIAAEVRQSDARYAVALLPQPPAWAAAPGRLTVGVVASTPRSSPSARLSVPLRI